jgi:hypothetical protein
MASPERRQTAPKTVPVNAESGKLHSGFGIANPWNLRLEATCALRHIRTTEGRQGR